eukprot:2649384-Prymnesium_polylepis.1
MQRSVPRPERMRGEIPLHTAVTQRGVPPSRLSGQGPPNVGNNNTPNSCCQQLDPLAPIPP